MVLTVSKRFMEYCGLVLVAILKKRGPLLVSFSKSEHLRETLANCFEFVHRHERNTVQIKITIKENDAPCDNSTFCTRDQSLIKHRGGGGAGGKLSNVKKYILPPHPEWTITGADE